MRNAFPTVALTAIVAAITVAAPPARAVDQDAKVYPPFSCTKAGTSGKLILDAGQRVFNDSTTEFLSVICAVVRDNTTESWRSARILVRDQSTAYNVFCSAQSRTADGAPLASSVKNTTGSSSAFIPLTFAPLAEADEGYFFISCAIPPRGVDRSGIASVLVNER